MKLLFIYLFIFTAFRVATVLFFKPADLSFTSLLPAFWLGLKYDLRWIAILLLPIAFVSLFKHMNPFYSSNTKKFWTYYLGVVTLFVLFIYGADFAQFAHAQARINADNMLPAREYRNTFALVWKNYPVIWISIALVGSVLMVLWMFGRQHLGITDKNAGVHKFSYRRRWHAVSLMILAWFIYGFFTGGPLKINRAFKLSNSFTANLALNPMQNFFTTLRLKNERKKVEEGKLKIKN